MTISTTAAGASDALVSLIRECGVRFPSIAGADLGSLLERIGDATVVLLGEASHGSAEFYEMRARITRALIEHKGFTLVTAEADWPDAARVNRYIRNQPQPAGEPPGFSRFPAWMWRNAEFASFAEWLRAWNAAQPPERWVACYGLDLYSMYGSIASVLRYLDTVDPDAARLARHRYGCLLPWEGDPARYGATALAGYQSCEAPVVAMLHDLLRRRLDYARRDGHNFLDAVQNARLIANAERYYRVMYQGSVASWNLRDSHMFETLQAVLTFHGPGTRAVVWAHNSHIGDARATEMGRRGEHNIGQLAREAWGDGSFRIGFGTDHGTVAAADDWDQPMQVMMVRPSHPASYESLFHRSGGEAFLVQLREPERPALREELLVPRLERAIGVIYRPDTELESHYFHAILPRQFDAYAWFDETRAVTPLGAGVEHGMPETWPFGL
jgi:protein-L-isoaspartate(D-aspartate) O-methyltransferase